MGDRGRRGVWWAVAVVGTVGVITLALLAGPGPAQSPNAGQHWAERALQWIAARDRAAHRSVTELMQFEAPTSVHLLCCNQAGPIRGREALASFVTGMFGDSLEEETMGRSYIDASGAVVEYRFPAGGSAVRPFGGGPPMDVDQLQVSDNRADGAAMRTVHAMALQFLRAPVDDGRAWYGRDLAAARAVTDRYLSAWSGRDARAVAQLYAGSASLVDSVLGVRLLGRGAIGAYAAEHGGVPLRLDRIRGGGGPALYGFWGGYHSHLTAFTTYTGSDGSGCPGGITAALQLEHGQIVAERRYHDVPSSRRCLTSAALPQGWWTHAVIPAPIRDTPTGTVTVAGRRIEVHNGTRNSEELVRWAVTRYLLAGLAIPNVSVIAFSAEAHRAECAGHQWGLALRADPSSRIYLCFTVGRPATAFQRRVLLHELAHVWMWQNLDAATQQQFLALMHLPTWEAADVLPSRRGMEQAADVIAWALADGASDAGGLANRSCPDLTKAFQVLTGGHPLRPPCPPRQ